MHFSHHRTYGHFVLPSIQMSPSYLALCTYMEVRSISVKPLFTPVLLFVLVYRWLVNSYINLHTVLEQCYVQSFSVYFFCRDFPSYYRGFGFPEILMVYSFHIFMVAIPVMPVMLVVLSFVGADHSILIPGFIFILFPLFHFLWLRNRIRECTQFINQPSDN